MSTEQKAAVITGASQGIGAALVKASRDRTETGEAVSIESQIINLYTANKSGFLKLQDGTEVHLNRLISVDGKPVCFTNY